MVMDVAKEMAKFDVMSAEGFYEENWKFVKLKPLNEQFEYMGSESSQFILNSGSLIPIVQFAIFLAGFKKLINFLCVQCIKRAKEKLWLIDIGIWAY